MSGHQSSHSMIDRLRRQVINVHEGPIEWHWVRDMLPPEEADAFDWLYFSNIEQGRIAGKESRHLGRVVSGLKTRRAAKGRPGDLIITHAPRIAFYTALLAGGAKRNSKFCAMSFNYTDLPTGLSHRQMCKTYRTVDHFAVYSQMERKLYADYFDQPIEKFEFLRWAVEPPILAPGPRTIAEPYLLALGSEARDYPTLMEAAARVPNRKIILIVRPRNLTGFAIPDNVVVMTDVDWDECWTIAWYSDAMLVPLRSSQTPNGHRTIVGAQHLGLPVIVTDSSGIRDYVTHDATGLLVPEHDPKAFADAIERVYDEPELMSRIGAQAKAFADTECHPRIHIDYFRYLAGLGQRAWNAI